MLPTDPRLASVMYPAPHTIHTLLDAGSVCRRRMVGGDELALVNCDSSLLCRMSARKSGDGPRERRRQVSAIGLQLGAASWWSVAENQSSLEA